MLCAVQWHFRLRVENALCDAWPIDLCEYISIVEGFERTLYTFEPNYYIFDTTMRGKHYRPMGHRDNDQLEFYSLYHCNFDK